jgi:hypothetical protein
MGGRLGVAWSTSAATCLTEHPPWWSAYVAAKAAFVGLTRRWAIGGRWRPSRAADCIADAVAHSVSGTGGVAEVPFRSDGARQESTARREDCSEIALAAAVRGSDTRGVWEERHPSQSRLNRRVTGRRRFSSRTSLSTRWRDHVLVIMEPHLPLRPRDRHRVRVAMPVLGLMAT